MRYKAHRYGKLHLEFAAELGNNSATNRMFDRYNDAARRTIASARAEAADVGSPFVKTEHLLLGLLKDKDGLLRRLMPKGTDVEALCREVRAARPAQKRVVNSAELPLSSTIKVALAHAATFAAATSSNEITPHHLVVGLFAESTCSAAMALQRYGITRDKVIRFIADPHLVEADRQTDEGDEERCALHRMVDGLPKELIGMARKALAGMKTESPYSESRPVIAAHRDPERRAPKEAQSGDGAAFTTDANGNILDGYYSFSRTEGEAVVTETHRFYQGHEVVLLDRLQLTDGGRKLVYSQEVRGPNLEQQNKVEFTVA